MMQADRKRMFLDAQDAVWSDVTRELAEGRKTSHWIWFVFPQLAALGRSGTARRFGIADLQEATDYLNDADLRARLIEAVDLMLRHAGERPEDILGEVDALKLRSSMTLFAHVPGAPEHFRQALDTFYAGSECPLTQRQIGLQGG